MPAQDGVTPVNAENVLHKQSHDDHYGNITNHLYSGQGNIQVEGGNFVTVGLGSSGAQYLNPLAQITAYAKWVVPIYAHVGAVNVGGANYLPASAENFGAPSSLIPNAYVVSMAFVTTASYNISTINVGPISMGSNFLAVIAQGNVNSRVLNTAYFYGYVLLSS